MAFNLVGAGGVAVQLALLWLLTAQGVPVVAATLLAVEAALIHNFVWHQGWTWRDRPSRGLDESLARLRRFHAVNGLVSLLGNVAITTALVAIGCPPVAANGVAILACSLVNFAGSDRVVFRPTTIAVVAIATLSAPLEAQDTSAIAGWDRHVTQVERRLADAADGAFFRLDEGGTDWRQKAIAGDVPMRELEAPGVDGGKIHHWAGAIYVPNTTVTAVVDRLLATAGEESKFYEEVTASRLLERRGDRVRVFMKLQRDAGVITANYNTEHDVQYRRLGTRATGRSVSTRIAELADAGTPREREKAPGDDHGFLWRLNAYWRYEQAGSGVLIECESVSLSRSVPLLVRPLVGPIADRIARESLKGTLVSMRKALGSRLQALGESLKPKAQSLLHSYLEELRPQLSGDEEPIAGGIVGDAVENVDATRVRR